METLGETVPGTLIELSPVEESVVDVDSDVVVELQPIAPDPVDDHASSVATTELDTSGDESGDHETAPPGDPRFVSMHRDWWRGTNGVVDLRPFGPGVAATSGRVHRYCETTIGRLLGAGKAHGDVVFKVGTARDVFEKFNSYVAHDPTPFTHMYLLHRTCENEGSGFLAAGLIERYWDHPRFINAEHNDLDGTGGAMSGTFVYVTVCIRERPSSSR